MNINNFLRKITIIIATNFIIFFNVLGQTKDVETPDQFLSRVSECAINALKNNLDPNRIDLTKLNEIIEIYMLPYVDFKKTTRLTVGHHWQTITEEQKEQLIDLFSKKLVRTYTMALLQISPESKMSTYASKFSTSNKNISAKSVIQQPNGQKIQIGYRLYLDDNCWKIYDVSIEGIWLIENYRAQFNKEINRYGVENLIEKLRNNR